MAPFLFVTGTIASQVNVTTPVTIGSYTIGLEPAARVAQELTDISGAITRTEMSFIKDIIHKIELVKISDLKEVYNRSMSQARRSL